MARIRYSIIYKRGPSNTGPILQVFDARKTRSVGTGNALITFAGMPVDFDQNRYYIRRGALARGRVPNEGMSDLEQVRANCRNAQRIFTRWNRTINAIQFAYPQADVDAARLFLYRGFQGFYLLATSVAISAAHRNVITARYNRGARDATTARGFILAAADADAPTGPVAWVSASSRQQVNLANAAAPPGGIVIPDGVDLLGDAWVQGINR